MVGFGVYKSFLLSQQGWIVLTRRDLPSNFKHSCHDSKMTVVDEETMKILKKVLRSQNHH